MTSDERRGQHFLGSNLPRIPSLEASVNAGNYQDIPVDEENPLNSEELVDLKDYGIAGVSYYHISDGSNQPYCQQIDGSIPQILARKSVAEMLAKVNTRLDVAKLELFVWDTYRPLATQLGIWNYFWSDIKSKNPSFSDEAIKKELIKYVSDPNNFKADDSRTWPTHMTGASVDLTIRRKTDLKLLDMGAHFDQMGNVAHTNYFEDQLVNGAIEDDDPRLKNRRLLYFLMSEQGFTNYPNEYWHFDWGNQMHQLIRCLHSNGPAMPARYGII